MITAKIIEGMVRQIEYASKANQVYADVGEKAIAGGFGYWRIITKELDDSFDQEIFIEKIENQFSVYLDPKGNHAFIREGMTKIEFESKYPDKADVDWEAGLGDQYSLWYEKDKVFVAEYFYKEQYDKTIAQCIDLATGEVKIIELKDGVTPETLAAHFQVLRLKTKKAHKVKWAKMTGHEILEEGDWVGKEIPIIEVVGDKVNIEGKIYKRSLIRDAKDPQRMYNYINTHMTETMALIPRAPYLVTTEEIKGFEFMWDNANHKNYPYLIYRAQGTRVPKRELPPQIQTGAGQLLQISANDIQDNIGMYEASFGEKSNERTGIAIRSRSARSDFGTFHFSDNFAKAIIETTRQLIDIIPKIYDTERSIRIRGEEEIENIVEINQTITDMATGQSMIVNDLSVGKYDVVADIGIFSTRRQEATEMMANVMQAAPNISPLMLDLLFKASDWPYASEIEARLKKYMPQLLGSKEPIETETPQGAAPTPPSPGGAI
ncbi:MAG: hypothetical protein DDT40_01925 [candidate division WS2 bacterium]|nr:hypothetical protein [Candidatus Psychracetigena formicireducens]